VAPALYDRWHVLAQIQLLKRCWRAAAVACIACPDRQILIAVSVAVSDASLMQMSFAHKRWLAAVPASAAAPLS
jgi:hypothetical protein